MTNQEKLALIEETLELDEGTLTPETILEDLDKYDSMAKLSLIVMFDDEFGKKVEGAEIKAFETVNDIMALMEK
ncbi:MAG: acyl carrier protein [Firmicutes bacterium]|nr:acyl carrier protein [Bacillota bacterium]